MDENDRRAIFLFLLNFYISIFPPQTKSLFSWIFGIFKIGKQCLLRILQAFTNLVKISRSEKYQLKVGLLPIKGRTYTNKKWLKVELIPIKTL